MGNLNSVTDLFDSLAYMFTVGTSTRITFDKFKIGNCPLVERTSFFCGNEVDRGLYIKDLEIGDMPSCSSISQICENKGSLVNFKIGHLAPQVNLYRAFYGCTWLSNITFADEKIYAKGSLEDAFTNTKIQQEDFSKFDFSQVDTSASYAFANTPITQPIITANTKLFSLEGIYAHCNNLSGSVVVGDFPNATSTKGMFRECTKMTDCTLGNLSSVTNFSGMFMTCSALTSVTFGELGNFGASVTSFNTDLMFPKDYSAITKMTFLGNNSIAFDIARRSTQVPALKEVYYEHQPNVSLTSLTLDKCHINGPRLESGTALSVSSIKSKEMTINVSGLTSLEVLTAYTKLTLFGEMAEHNAIALRYNKLSNIEGLDLSKTERLIINNMSATGYKIESPYLNYLYCGNISGVLDVKSNSETFDLQYYQTSLQEIHLNLPNILEWDDILLDYNSSGCTAIEFHAPKIQSMPASFFAYGRNVTSVTIDTLTKTLPANGVISSALTSCTQFTFDNIKLEGTTINLSGIPMNEYNANVLLTAIQKNTDKSDSGKILINYNQWLIWYRDGTCDRVAQDYGYTLAWN